MSPAAERRVATVRAATERGARGVQRVTDWLLHPVRATALRRRLGTAPRPRRILVVCTGNICRSPYFEAVLQRALPDVAVESAGFSGADRPVPDEGRRVAAARGIALDAHRSRALHPWLLRTADLIVVMDPLHVWRLVDEFAVPPRRIVVAGDLDPLDRHRGIRDPFQQDESVFAASYDRLDRCAAQLLALLPTHS